MRGPIIVTRHPATEAFIRKRCHLGEGVETIAIATEADVYDRAVYGNIPLHLAAKAVAVVAVEFTGDPPRGQEYTLADMKAAGAVLRRYKVKDITDEDVDYGPFL